MAKKQPLCGLTVWLIEEIWSYVSWLNQIEGGLISLIKDSNEESESTMKQTKAR